MLPLLAIALCCSLALANDAFREKAAAAPQNAAVERDPAAQKQANLKFEHDNNQKEVEDAKKRFVDEQRALLEKNKQEREQRVQQARLDRQKFNAADNQAAKLKERHDFLSAQAKADQAVFLKQNPSKQVQPKPNQN